MINLFIGLILLLTGIFIGFSVGEVRHQKTQKKLRVAEEIIRQYRKMGYPDIPHQRKSSE